VALADMSDETEMAENDTMHKCRICVFELSILDGYEFGETEIEKIGDMVVDGCSEHTSISLDNDGKQPYLVGDMVLLTQCNGNRQRTAVHHFSSHSCKTHFKDSANQSTEFRVLRLISEF
jgi:hypothetical protein